MLAQQNAKDHGRPFLYLHGLKTCAKLYDYWETYDLYLYTCIDNLVQEEYNNNRYTETNIRISMNSYNKLIHLLVLIADLYLFRSPVGVIELTLYRGTCRYYRTYTYTEVPIGTIELILVLYFTLIHYSNSYHITA